MNEPIEQRLNNMSRSSKRNDEIRKEEEAAVVYKECLKNHAAAIGGVATDGCGEFMAAGHIGTAEALKCSACNCHRNFHRKHIQSQHSSSPAMIVGEKTINQMELILGSAEQVWQPATTIGGDYYVEVNDKEKMRRKRTRTKFSEQQKGRMLKFAEKAEWKIHKVDDTVGRHFCQELGISTRVLKVWIHNHKHKFANRPHP